jgi:hypothetical protein
MASVSAPASYVFTLAAVHAAIHSLTSQPIHEHFPGYLAVLRAKSLNGNKPASMADIVGLHDRYLRVEGAPEKAPYVRPFKSRGTGLEQINRNVPGSYAPSSIRARLKKVLEVVGEGPAATYDLKPDHANLALKHLLMNKRVPVIALATFLYRDYALTLDEVTVEELVFLFRQDFGLPETEDGSAIFETLFSLGEADFNEEMLTTLAADASE